MEKWTKEKAWSWYDSLPWIRGFNFVPSIALNKIEMWQEYGWEKMRDCIESELSLAKDWGFNSIRVGLPLELYIDDKKVLLEHLEEFLGIAWKHGIYTMIYFAGDCLVQKHDYHWPKYGPQPFDLGYHSGTAISPHVVLPGPGYTIIDEPEYEAKFYDMVDEVVAKYAKDKRILLWDIWNEPGNSHRGMKSWPYIEKAFAVARSHDPIQPCSADAWSFSDDHPLPEIERKALEASDVITYHCYHHYEGNVKVAEALKTEYGRPMMNTEWLHRIWHCDVKELFPYFRKERIGCFNWGFVTGKSQTREPWEWLFNEMDKGNGADWDMEKWQHDLVRANHRP